MAWFKTLLVMEVIIERYSSRHVTYLDTGCRLKIIKSHRVNEGLIVFGPSRPPPPPSPPPPLCQHFSTFRKKTLNHISSNHTRLTNGCGKIVWHPSRWPWVKATKLLKRDAIYLVPTINRSLQNLVGISPWSCFPSDLIWERFCQNLFSDIFQKI